MQTQTIGLYQNGGKAVRYNKVGKYNYNDVRDIEDLARYFAREYGYRAEVLPSVHVKSKDYDTIFGALRGTIYEGKCPDMRITLPNGKQYYVEFESYKRPYNPDKLRHMLNSGSRQSDSIIIDKRDSNMQAHHIKRQIINRLRDASFGRPITNVWSYDGKKVVRVWGEKI